MLLSSLELDCKYFEDRNLSLPPRLCRAASKMADCYFVDVFILAPSQLVILAFSESFRVFFRRP